MHQCDNLDTVAPVDLDQWWCPLALVAAMLSIICLLWHRRGIYYFPALEQMALEAAQIQAYRDQMTAAGRLTAILCCFVSVFYHLCRIMLFGASWSFGWPAAIIMGICLKIYQPNYDQMVRVHSVCCFLLWPALFV